jgi:hypothetical protein
MYHFAEFILTANRQAAIGGDELDVVDVDSRMLGL